MVSIEEIGRRRAAWRENDDGDVIKRFSQIGKDIREIKQVKKPETSIRKDVEISMFLHFVAITFERAPKTATYILIATPI